MALLIDPDGIYTDHDVRRALDLDLSLTALRRARRSGDLRFVRKGRCVLYRGSWLLAWVEGDNKVGESGGPER